MLRTSRDRVAFAALAIGTIGLGLFVHARVLALPDFVRDKLGDALWATMVAWCVGAVAPRARVGWRSVAATAVCWAVEASQLWHAPVLEATRATTLGSLVLGRGFDPGDLPAYAVGVIAAALGETIVRSLRARRRISGEPPTPPGETELRYDRIEQQLTDALPELRPAAELYWKTEGAPGSDCGPYVFFEDMFARYVEVLLALPSSPRRDALLRRAFAFAERMLASDDGGVRGLAFIGLYEGQEDRWLARAAPFVGPLAVAELDRTRPDWRSPFAITLASRSEILDGYGVRHVIARELRAEGVRLERVPGRTYAEGLEDP